VSINMKHFQEEKGVTWKREECQRNCIQEGINKLNLKDTDLVLVSDIDEIPDKSILKDLKMGKKINANIKKDSKFSLALKAFFYFIKAIFYKIINKDLQKLKSQLKLIYFILIKKFESPINFKMFNYYYLNYQKIGSSWPGVQCLQAK